MRDEEISNAEDIIDSRDIIARIEYLEDLRDNLEDPEGEWPGTDASEELASLVEFAKAGEDYSEDWTFGSTLIRDSYFTQYAEDLADDIGAINKDAAWPLCHIDWDAAADHLKQDYTSIEFDGVTYWVR